MSKRPTILPAFIINQIKRDRERSDHVQIYPDPPPPDDRESTSHENDAESVTLHF